MKSLLKVLRRCEIHLNSTQFELSSRRNRASPVEHVKVLIIIDGMVDVTLLSHTIVTGREATKDANLAKAY